MAVLTEHRCHRGERCVDATKTDTTTCGADCACHNGPHHPCSEPGGCGHTHRVKTQRTGTPIMAARGLCVTCQRVVTDAITELPRNYVELNLALAHGEVGMTDLVSATPDPPAPLRVDIAALRHDIVAAACTWAEPVSEKLGITWDSQGIDRHTRPGWRLQRATRILSLNMPVLLALAPTPVRDWADNGWYSTLERDNDPDGVDGALQLLALHQISRAALGQTRLVHLLPAPCPHCSVLALVRDNGADNVHCRNCRLKWSEADYLRLTLILVADHRAAVP